MQEYAEDGNNAMARSDSSPPGTANGWSDGRERNGAPINDTYNPHGGIGVGSIYPPQLIQFISRNNSLLSVYRRAGV